MTYVLIGITGIAAYMLMRTVAYGRWNAGYPGYRPSWWNYADDATRKRWLQHQKVRKRSKL